MLLDNRGFGCINRLQQACGGASFNNLLGPEAPAIDFAAHARSLGAQAEQVKTIPDLEGALERARRGRPDVDRGHRDGPGAALHGRRRVVGRAGARGVGPARGAGRARQSYDAGAPPPAKPEASVTVRIGVNPIGWTNDDLETLGDDISLDTCLRRSAAGRVRGQSSSGGSSRGGRRSSRRFSSSTSWTRVRVVQARTCSAGASTEEIAAMQDHAGLLTALGATAMVFAGGDGQRRTGALGVPALHAAAPGRGGLVEVRRGADRGRRITSPGAECALAYHHHMGTVVETEDEIDRLDAGHRDRRWASLLDTGHLTYAGGDVLGVARRHATGSSTSTARTSGRPCWSRRAAADQSFLDAVVEGVFTVPGDGCVDYKALLDDPARRRLRGLAGRGSGAGPEEGPPAHLRADGLRPPESACSADLRDVTRALAGRRPPP